MPPETKATGAPGASPTQDHAALTAEVDRLRTIAGLPANHPEYFAAHPSALVDWDRDKVSASDAKEQIMAWYRERLKQGPQVFQAADVNTSGAEPRATKMPWGPPEFAALQASVDEGRIARKDPRYVRARNLAFGEQLQAVAAHYKGAGTDPRLMAVASGASAQVGADGGFAVQKMFTIGMMESAFEEGAVLSRVDATEITGPNDGLQVLYLDETSRATGSRWGGIQVYRGAEADAATAKKPKFGRWESQLEDVIGAAYVTERLLQDAGALADVFDKGFRSEFTFKMEDEIIEGIGGVQCVGILTADCLVTVAKETGQLAATIVAENIMKMWSRVHPRSRMNGAWFYNVECEPQLQQMMIGTGASGQLVYMPPGGISGAQYGSIYGRPTIPIEYASALGTLGDIFFADFSAYKVITKGGIIGDDSIHVRFLNNERTFRWITRMNGAPKDKSAITPFKGTNTLSSFVALATRA